MEIDELRNRMRIFKQRKAFTLIELIVVLIILGVLAAIAVPAYFSMINKSKAAEVMLTIKNIKDQTLPCVQAHAHEGTWMDLTAKCGYVGTSASATYATMAVDFGWLINIVKIDATGNGSNGLTSGDNIIILYNFDGSVNQCLSQGVFVGLCPN